MKTHILPFVCLVLCVLGCGGTPYTPNTTAVSPTPANPTSNIANTGLTAPPKQEYYEASLLGQSLRIKAEGTGEQQVRQNIAEVDKTITYELLKKNADKHAGKAWAFTGTILEIAEKDGATVARISLDTWGTKAVMVGGPFETNFVEKDRVYVVGYLAGGYSYTSQANWQITIPALAARAMMKPADAGKYRK